MNFQLGKRYNKENIKMANLSGVIPAIATPLYANEDVDTASLKKLIDFVIDGGASGIFVLGSMGEGPALLDSQKKIAVDTAVKHTNGRVPVLAGISEVSTRRAIELGKALEPLNPDYLVITAPYYYSFPHPDSMLKYVQEIADAIKTPLVFYNCPGMTKNKVSIETLEKIMAIPQIKAIKDSSCDFEMVSTLLKKYTDKNKRSCSILQGDESVYDKSLLMGADGLITGGGTVYVSILSKLYNAAIEQDEEAAAEFQHEFITKRNNMLGGELAIDWMYRIKRELKTLGVCESNVTSPFLKRD